MTEETKRKPVSFLSTKRIPKRINIDFSEKRHDKISFITTERKPKHVKVAFFEEVDAGPRLKGKIYQRKHTKEYIDKNAESNDT